MTRDNLGNTYVIAQDNSIEKIDASGKILFTYNESKFGTPTSIDASNALNIVVFYHDFNKVLVLNNNLSLIQSIDFNTVHIKAEVACGSTDNYFWLYDDFEHKLKKVDRTGKILNESVDLLNQFGYELNPVSISADENYVFLDDTAQGIYIFDLYGSEVMNIPLRGIKSFQADNDKIYFIKNMLLHQYNFKTFQDNTLDVLTSVEPQQIYFNNNMLCTLLKNQLDLYRITTE